MEIAFGTKRTVNLIGRYLMITYPFTPGRISVFIFTGYPCATCGIQQVLCSQNIGHQEKLRILNATVYMAFSSKIHYIVKLVLTKKAVGQFTITNVTFHKKAPFVINVVGNRSKISGISQCIEHYHNSSFLEYGGSPDKATRLAFVYAIDKYLKENNKYTKGESKITFPDVQDCLVLVSSNFSTQTSYENQTKKAITNKFVQEAMTEFFRSRLQVYFLENKQEADRIAEQVLINKRSRETAERARITVKKKLSGNLDIANRVQKFVDCRSRDASRRELYIVEGDSAMGSVKLSRDAEFQGIMPIRGKILNCLKADYARIFKSEIITDLLRVMGCGVEVRDKHVKDLTAFDLGSLRWNKIVICTDADYDGFQIRTLVLTMLYRLVPTLIREGYVYIAETPLFEITCKDKTWFAYNETEKADILKQLEGKKISVARSKGLGENEPEMMWLTTMNPETRRLIKVMPEDAEKTAFYFDLLLGDNLAGRKEYIAENGSQYLEMADIS